jgi:chromosome partitioning protein
MRKIAIIGFKGGIGKTTTCVNLGAGLARRGHRVLLIDTDTQANLSIALGLKSFKYSMADILSRKVQAEDCILRARRNLDLIPSDIRLFMAQQRMVLEMGREEIFAELFSGLEGYDFQFLDCAPSVSLLTVNAVSYVQEVFIPVSMEMLALAGMRQFMSYLRTISRILGHGAVIRLIIPTFYDARRRISERVLQTLKSDFGSRVTEPIRVDTLLSEAPGVGRTIFEYSRTSRGAEDYGRLSELVEQMGALNSESSGYVSGD